MGYLTIRHSRFLIWPMYHVRVHTKSLQSCPTLWPHELYSLPGSSVHVTFRQEYWSGLSCPSPGDLLDPGIEPTSLVSPALAGGFCTKCHLRRPCTMYPGNCATICLWNSAFQKLDILFILISLLSLQIWCLQIVRQLARDERWGMVGVETQDLWTTLALPDQEGLAYNLQSVYPQEAGSWWEQEIP